MFGTCRSEGQLQWGERMLTRTEEDLAIFKQFNPSSVQACRVSQGPQWVVSTWSPTSPPYTVANDRPGRKKIGILRHYLSRPTLGGVDLGWARASCLAV